MAGRRVLDSFVRIDLFKQNKKGKKLFIFVDKNIYNRF